MVGAAKPAAAWEKSSKVLWMWAVAGCFYLSQRFHSQSLFIGRRRAVCHADLLVNFRGKLRFPLIGIEPVLLLFHIIERV